jgi:hypothetical protein
MSRLAVARLTGLAALAALLAAPAVASANPSDGLYAATSVQDPAAKVNFEVSGGKITTLNVSHLQFNCLKRPDIRRNPPPLDGAIDIVDGQFRGRFVGRSTGEAFAGTIGGRLLPPTGAQGWLQYAIRFQNGDRCTSVPAPLEWAATNRDLEFTSGFEPPVAVQPPVVVNGNWHFPITGADRGFDWHDDLPGHGGNAFVPLVPGTEPIDQYAYTGIQEVPGPDGSPTHALIQEVFRDAEFYPGRRVRNQFGLFRPGRRGSVSYWIKLQPNLARLMPRGEKSWRFLQEIRGAGQTPNDYRMSIGLFRHKTGPIEWEIAGRRLLPTYKQDWTILNAHTPVPIGKWFRLETSWLISRSDGYLRVSVNGVPIADHEGRTKLNEPIDSMQIFKVYTGASSLAVGRAYQWIDDVEIRRGLLSAPPQPQQGPAQR